MCFVHCLLLGLILTFVVIEWSWNLNLVLSCIGCVVVAGPIWNHFSVRFFLKFWEKWVLWPNYRLKFGNPTIVAFMTRPFSLIFLCREPWRRSWSYSQSPSLFTSLEFMAWGTLRNHGRRVSTVANGNHPKLGIVCVSVCICVSVLYFVHRKLKINSCILYVQKD